MLVSVVIPLYNKEKHVLRAVKSVLTQTYKNFELIVVNDGSTDKSADVVKSLRDPRIRLIQQENGGVSKARNEGVKYARGKWVAFLDADDEYEPTFLEEAVIFLKKHETSGMTFLGTNYYLGSKTRTSMSLTLKSGRYDYFALFKDQRSPNHSSSTIVKKDIFIDCGGFPEGVTHFEDWIAWFKLGIAGEFGYINKPLATYHSVENSVARSEIVQSEFFSNAILLPITVNKILEKQQIQSLKRKNIKKCVYSFSLSIAEILAMEGAKILSLKMLRFIPPFRFIGTGYKKILRTILFLIVPNCLRKTYRQMRQK